MRRVTVVVSILVLILACASCVKKYETALVDLDASTVLVKDSLVQTMDMADKAAKAAGEKGPLYDEKDRAARLRTCYEMRALIHTTLLGEKVEYDMATGDLFYMKGEEKVVIGEGSK